MLKELNDFLNRNATILTQYHDKVLGIEAFIDNEINDLVSLSNKHPGKISDTEQILLRDFIAEIEARNSVAMTSISTFIVQSERILADAKLFVNSKQDGNNQLGGIKNSIMQNLTNHKEILDKDVERVRTKITKLNRIIADLKDDDSNINRERVAAIVEEEVQKALKNFEAPLQKISKFNQLETCNSIDCLKYQISSLQQKVIDQNEAIKKISMAFAKQIDESNILIKQGQRDNLELKNYVDENTMRLQKEKSRSNYEIHNRIRNLEDSLRLGGVKKYY